MTYFFSEASFSNSMNSIVEHYTDFAKIFKPADNVNLTKKEVREMFEKTSPYGSIAGLAERASDNWTNPNIYDYDNVSKKVRIIKALTKALKNNLSIEVFYKDLQGNLSLRLIAPYKIVLDSISARTAEGIRKFKFDQIVSISAQNYFFYRIAVKETIVGAYKRGARTPVLILCKGEKEIEFAGTLDEINQKFLRWTAMNAKTHPQHRDKFFQNFASDLRKIEHRNKQKMLKRINKKLKE